MLEELHAVLLFLNLNVLDVCLALTAIACVAIVSSRGSSRKLGQEQKKNDGGGGGDPPSSTFFNFCFRSNFRAITRLETLATQASLV